MFPLFHTTIILVEAGMGLMGILCLIAGRFPYRPGRPVTGYSAYLAGAIMCIPLAAVLPITYGMRRDQSYADWIGKWIFINTAASFVCVCVAFLLAALLFNPSGGMARQHWLKEVDKRKGRRRGRTEDNDDEDRPRRRRKRRREEEGDLDDRPPRRRPAEDDDEDRPRRRPRDDEDDAEAPPRRRPPADEDDDEPRPRRSADDDDDRTSHRPGPPPLPPRG